MEMFTSEELVKPEEENIVILDPMEDMNLVMEDQMEKLTEVSASDTIDLFTSQDQNLLMSSTLKSESEMELERIRILLEDYLVEDSIESTTDYYTIISGNLEDIKESVNVIGHDQQTIGLLSVGSSILIIGILAVYVFLGRIR